MNRSSDTAPPTAPTTPTTPTTPNEVHSTEATGCLVRIYWMFLGNGLLALCAYLIMKTHKLFSGADIGFWLAALSLVVVRYVDIVQFHGTTADGKSATRADWIRYTVRMTIIAVVLWIAAHQLGAFVVPGSPA